MKIRSNEPFVNLENEGDFYHWSKSDEIIFNQNLRQRAKHHAFKLLFDMISENGIGGDYLEFGCHRGRTFRMALTEARRHNLNSMQFHAFDSFEGLPETGSESSEHKIWKKGALSTSLEDFKSLVNTHGIYLEKVHYHKGFYSDTLNGALKERLAGEQLRIALVTVDCDLYESARDVFSFIDCYLTEGTLIYVDDFFAGYRGNSLKGVGRALHEFREAVSGQWNLIEHITVGWWGKTFVVSSRV